MNSSDDEEDREDRDDNNDQDPYAIKVVKDNKEHIK